MAADQSNEHGYVSRHAAPAPKAEPGAAPEPKTVSGSGAVPGTAPDSEPALDPTILLPGERQGLQTRVLEPVEAPHILSASELTPRAEANREKRESHRHLAVAFLLMVVLLGAATAIVTYGLELWGGKSVPDVTNERQANAVADLEAKGFVVDVQEEPVDDAVGFVISTDPPAGGRYEAGTHVTVTVGSARVIPQVTGMTQEQAQEALSQAGVLHMEVVAVPSSEAEGTVLAVEPGEGESFTSRDTVTLTIASPYTLPDLTGKTEEEAQKTLEELGLKAKVNYVESEEEGHTVLATDPAPGATFKEGDEVTLTVADPYPSDEHLLAQYFAHTPADIAKFLDDADFKLVGAAVDGRGEAQAQYQRGGTTIRLCSDPFAREFDADGDAGDVIAKGTDFEGVRYEYDPADLPAGVDGITLGAVHAVMEECGLSGIVDSCTQDTIVLPQGYETLATDDGRRFLCVEGAEDDYVWTVLIAQAAPDSEDLRVVVTYAPEPLYGYYDLSENGESICSFTAFVDLYA